MHNCLRLQDAAWCWWRDCTTLLMATGKSRARLRQPHLPSPAWRRFRRRWLSRQGQKSGKGEGGCLTLCRLEHMPVSWERQHSHVITRLIRLILLPANPRSGLPSVSHMGLTKILRSSTFEWAAGVLLQQQGQQRLVQPVQRQARRRRQRQQVPPCHRCTCRSACKGG